MMTGTHTDRTSVSTVILRLAMAAALLLSHISVSYAAASDRVTFTGISITSAGTMNVPSSGGDLQIYCSYQDPDMWLNPEPWVEEANEHLADHGFDCYMEVVTFSQAYMQLRMKPNASAFSLEFLLAGGRGGQVTVVQAGYIPPVPPPPVDTTERLDLAGNWKIVRTYTNAQGTEWYEDLTFYDGLGYAEQVINIGAGARSGRNVVTPITYDALRRADALTWLPYVSDTASARTREVTPLASQRSYYQALHGLQDGTYAFTRKEYEGGIGGRPLSLTRPGSAYTTGGVTRSAATAYGTNAAGEVLRFTVTGFNSDTVLVGHYACGTLRMTRTTDEDSLVVTVFRDRQDRKVLERRTDGAKTADTYYIHDIFNNLRCVLPPMASAVIEDRCVSAAGHDTLLLSEAIVQDYGFTYRYDGRGNISSKKLPGAAPQRFIHDRAGRQVMWQDGNMREDSLWIYTGYDDLGREAARSVVRTSLPADSLEARYARTSNTYPRTAAYQYRPAIARLKLNPLPPRPTGLLESALALEYDIEPVNILGDIRWQKYPYLAMRRSITSSSTVQRPAAALPFRADSAVQLSQLDTARYSGRKEYERFLLVTKAIRAEGQLPDTDYLQKAYYYDSRARVIQEVCLYPSGDTLRTSYAYDFTGNVTRTLATLIRPSSSSQRTVTSDMARSYSRRGLLLSESTTVTVRSSSGAVVSRAGAPMEMSYTDLGRLEERRMGGGQSPVTDSLRYNIQGWLSSQRAARGGTDIFSLNLAYFSPSSPATEARYNGSVSECSWRQAGQDGNTYVYSYDSLGRLAGSALNGGSAFTERDIEYDGNSNITALKRYGGNASLINDLHLTYQGNHLSSVTDGDATYRYAYDQNGNLTHDGMEGSAVAYNMLNMPRRVTKGLQTLSYGYFADGSRYSATGTDAGHLYEGPFELSSSGALTSVEFVGGRFNAASSSLAPTWFITDHLGSVRSVVCDDGTILQQNDYYPYGERHGNAQLTAGSNRWQFSGKENQQALGYNAYDFGARFYNHLQWTTMDPMAEKYYGLSPYAYCAGDPVNMVDPEGLDIYEIDSEGRLVNRTENKETDTFYLVRQTDEGKYERTGKTVSFKYGTIMECKGYFYSPSNNQDSTNDGSYVSLYKVCDDEAGTALFELFADNTKVEWSQSKTGKNSEPKTNYLTSSHKDDEELGFESLCDLKLINVYKLREHIHNHPRGSQTPSGGRDQQEKTAGNFGDVGTAKHLYEFYTKRNCEVPIMKLYKGKGQYLIYDKDFRDP